MSKQPQPLRLSDLGPPPKTGDDWYFTPRPAEILDAAQIRIVSGPKENPNE